MTNRQIEILRDEATRAGDAGVRQACNAALRDVPGEPWVAAAARKRVEALRADIVRHAGLVRSGEWLVSVDALARLTEQS